MNFPKIFLLSLFSISLLACSNNNDSGASGASGDSGLTLNFSESPVSLDGIQVQYSKDVAYDEDEATTFDIFLPDSDQATPLIIFIHGGGFTGGDKDAVYEETRQQQIRDTLDEGIAYATINYRLLETVDEQGVIKSLNDTKRCLQYIRYYASSFNIDKENIALYGVSAGAGASMWLAFTDDMAGQGNEDDIDQESTRVAAVGAIETQATYDLVKWETEVLEPVGVNLDIAITLGLEQLLYSFYGIENTDQLYNSPEIADYRARVDMLALMSADDPDLWVDNTMIDDGLPLPKEDEYDMVSAIFHHPLHAMALVDQANLVGITNIAYIPKLGVEDPSGEAVIPFLIRHIDF